ncbi:carboxypeptidase regulatory-like domain-containing protein, partial [Candidatus Micrarchaeota archaeon]|nr:carboxypeptidase regulatory-like domain-containing protein [Candidatus Micrarchaeota archaeon]
LTDATGFYNFTILDGSYTVSASKTNYTSPSSTPSVVAPSAETSLNFTMLKYPGLNGTILNATNTSQALSGASITLSQSGVTKYSATTISSGVYAIADITPGMYDVSISLSGYATDSTTSYNLNVGDVTKTLNVNLTYIYPAFLNGTVTNSAGALSGAIISAIQGGVTINTTTSNSNGVYSFSFPAGVTNVTASLTEYGSQSVSSYLAGNNYYTQNFVLVLAPTPTPTPTPVPATTGPSYYYGGGGSYSSTSTPTPTVNATPTPTVTPTPTPMPSAEEEVTVELSSSVGLKAKFKKDSTQFKLTYTQTGSDFVGNLTYRLPLNYSDYASGLVKITPAPLSVVSGSIITASAVNLKDGEKFELTVDVAKPLPKSIAANFTAPTKSASTTILTPTLSPTPGSTTGLFTAGNLQIVGGIILVALVVVGFGFMRRKQALKVKKR